MLFVALDPLVYSAETEGLSRTARDRHERRLGEPHNATDSPVLESECTPIILPCKCIESAALAPL